MEGQTVGLLFFIVSLAILVFYLYVGWRIFEKAGKAGWKSIIPVYNVIVTLRIIGRPGWWLLLTFIPVVQLYPLAMISIDLARSFGKSTGFGIGLLLLGPIFGPLLAFGDATYDGPAGAEDTRAAKQQTKISLQRIDRGVRLFVCLSGFLAAFGLLLLKLRNPLWEAPTQWGFYGGAAGLVFMGFLQLLQAFVLEEEPVLRRLIRGMGFFLTISVVLAGWSHFILDHYGSRRFIDSIVVSTPDSPSAYYIKYALYYWGFYYQFTASAIILAVISLLLLGEVFTWSNQTEATTEA